MLNLFRMEIHSMFRSKSIYITFAALFAILIIAFGTMKLVTSPNMLQTAAESGMEFDDDDKNDAAEFLASTQSDFISNLLFNGGLMTVLMAIISCIAVCSDFETGFAKNIFSYHTKRSSYILSKLGLLSVISILFIAVLSVTTFVLFRVFGFDNPLGSPLRLLSMFGIGWLGLISLAAQSIFFCMLTRNTIAGIILSIICGLGTVAGALDLAVSPFGIHIVEYFPSYNVLMAPYIAGSSDAANSSILAVMLGGNMAISAPVLSVIVSLVWTVVYVLLSTALLNRKDIC